MDMYEFLVLAQGFMLGWVACRFYMAWKIHKTIKKIADDNGIDLNDMAETFLETRGIQTSVIQVPNLFTELTKNSILLYNKDTGKFIAQAETIEELAENVYKFDNIKFAYVNHNTEKFWFVEGKVRTDLKEIE